MLSDAKIHTLERVPKLYFTLGANFTSHGFGLGPTGSDYISRTNAVVTNIKVLPPVVVVIGGEGQRAVVIFIPVMAESFFSLLLGVADSRCVRVKN